MLILSTSVESLSVVFEVSATNYHPSIDKFRYMNFDEFTDMTRISQDFSDCGLHNGKYTLKQLIEICGLRALTESLKVLEKVKISERKVQITVMMGS
jgi:hypothetical protein